MNFVCLSFSPSLYFYLSSFQIYLSYTKTQSHTWPILAISFHMSCSCMITMSFIGHMSSVYHITVAGYLNIESFNAIFVCEHYMLYSHTFIFDESIIEEKYNNFYIISFLTVNLGFFVKMFLIVIVKWNKSKHNLIRFI